MDQYLSQDEMLPNEKVINVIPYKPFSILIITNRRIIGKRMLHLGPKRFEGAILYNRIVELKYLPGKPLVGIPGMLVKFKREDGRIDKIMIRFQGITAKIAGFDSEAAYQVIAAYTKAGNDIGE